MLRYTINPDSEVPVYRQLVDQINAEIRSGALKTGAQLPTVREMAEQMNLSCGTVKRVYDTLRELGDIEMTRRRGTFVKYVRQDRDSRKMQAMVAIDRMIRQLSDLNFSPAEIQIFLSLKMREWGLKWSGIRIALVTQYTELSCALAKQLERIGNVKIIMCEIEQIREYPYSIDEESDVIIASAEDAQTLIPILPDQSKLIKAAFAPKSESLLALAGAREKHLGVLCMQGEFPELIRKYLNDADLTVLSVDLPIPEDLDAVVLPPEWEKLCPPEMCKKLQNLPQIVFDYSIDEGTMIYLEERINRIRDERQVRPGILRF